MNTKVGDGLLRREKQRRKRRKEGWDLWVKGVQRSQEQDGYFQVSPFIISFFVCTLMFHISLVLLSLRTSLIVELLSFDDY